MAVSALMKKEVSRIILARPAVEAGEKLGFLPGDMYAKVNPYLRPLYDALFDMMDMERAARAIERGDIEIAPLGFMRGRTLNDSFVILDEAQNATAEQMKMFLTRLGFHSKVVVTGDITQVDLPPERVSGLIEVREILRDVEGIEFVYFDERDVVRHKLVQDIIKAYDQHQNPAQSSGPSPGAAGRRMSPVPHNKQPKPATPSSPLTDSLGPVALMPVHMQSQVRRITFDQVRLNDSARTILADIGEDVGGAGHHVRGRSADAGSQSSVSGQGSHDRRAGLCHAGGLCLPFFSARTPAW